MIRALMSSASGMKGQELQIDTIANNIANVNTTGFKKNSLAFRSLMYQTLREPGAPTAQGEMNPSGLQVGSGTEVASSLKTFRQGELQQTNNPFDLGLHGAGFFQVQLGSGELRYTRDGSFVPDSTGQLVTPNGHILQPTITIPPDALEVIVAEDGTVSVRNIDSGPPQQIGTIQLHRFPNPSGLKAQGGNLYSETGSSGAPQQGTPGTDGTAFVRQGFIERSNVQVVEELVALILAQRHYEINSRAIRVSDEMLQQVSQIVR